MYSDQRDAECAEREVGVSVDDVGFRKDGPLFYRC